MSGEGAEGVGVVGGAYGGGRGSQLCGGGMCGREGLEAGVEGGSGVAPESGGGWSCGLTKAFRPPSTFTEWSAPVIA